MAITILSFSGVVNMHSIYLCVLFCKRESRVCTIQKGTVLDGFGLDSGVQKIDFVFFAVLHHGMYTL